MSKISRDRLDGTSGKSIAKEVFLAPGRVILWLQYMFPQNGIRGVALSARHAKSPLMTWFYSIAFWVCFSALGVSWITGSV